MMTTTETPRDRPVPLDRLAVTGIQVVAHHGVLAEERRDGQLFLADLVLHLDTAPAALSDDLHDTVDYGSLVDRVAAAMASDPVDLIETLAQRLADICLQDARVVRAEVSVHKPGAPIAATFGDVHLTITRSRAGGDHDPERSHA